MSKAKQLSQYSKICKIVCIVLCCAAVAATATFVVLSAVHANDNNAKIAAQKEKDKYRKPLQYITINLGSTPYDTDVIFDYTGKTKMIRHYTSGSWESKDEYVDYNRYDELFDYFYDKISRLSGDYQRNTSGSALEPVYAITAAFKTDEELKTLGSSFSSHYNPTTKQTSWTLSGHVYFDGWEDLLKIAEIDENIFSEGTSFDLHHTSYEQ